MAAKYPVYYRPRPYQAEMHQMWRENRIGVAVFPRQTGKDTAMSIDDVQSRLQKPKTTGVYVSLDKPMIRNILWDKTYQDPVTGQHIQMLQDNVPRHLVDWRGTAMEGRFANGSRLKLDGYFQSGKDKNGVGTSFQDYNFTELALFFSEDPIPRLMPIIMNESDEKKLRVASTPRGKRHNPLWKLMESTKGMKDAKVIIRTIDDVNEMMVRAGQAPVLSEYQLEVIRDSYLKRYGNDRMFEQEYYCSFEEMDAAAVYGEALSKLMQDGRDTDFNLDPGHPVYVAFDIGSAGRQSDATSWIAFQWFNGRLFLYDCGEGHGKALPDYIDDLRMKHWFNKLDTIILPWDAEHHQVAITETPADMVKKKFGKVYVLAKSNKVYKLPGSGGDMNIITDIQQTRMTLYNTVIHKTNCDQVLDSLENYKYKFDEKTGLYSDKPQHDKYSHMMDALRYVVQSSREIDFFGSGNLHGDTRKPSDYVEDWSGVW